MKKSEIVFIDKNIPYLPEVFLDIADVHIFSGRELSNDDLIEKKCSALFTRSTVKVNEQLLAGTKVKFVATATSGIDHVDIEYLRRTGIYFDSALGSNANSVAEYIVYSILKWAIKENINLRDKTLGIIGYGNVGKLVAMYADKLGINILLNDPPLFELGFSFPFEYCELSELISNSDIITNHVPLTKSGQYGTLNLLNNNNLKLLKDNSLFLHTSRGGVVDENSLIANKIMKNLNLVIDVWENEPDFNPELAELSDFATPHIAGHAFDSKLIGSKMMINAFNNYSGMHLNSKILDIELQKKQKYDFSQFTTNKNLLDKIESSRCLQFDYQEFILFANLQSEEQKIKFENYRKNYPIRREIL